MDSKRLTILDYEDYQIDLEYNKMYVVVHIPRLKLTKTVYSELSYKVFELWEFVKEVEYQGLWTAVPKDNKTLGKLANRLGFEYLGEADGFLIYEFKHTEEQEKEE